VLVVPNTLSTVSPVKGSPAAVRTLDPNGLRFIDAI